MSLDAIDLLEAVHVPDASNIETALLLVALMLRSIYRVPIELFQEFKKLPWEKTPEMRMLDLQQSLGSDILGAVSSMLSGYPERVNQLFWKERGACFGAELDAYRRDYETFYGSEGRTAGDPSGQRCAHAGCLVES